MAALKTVNNCKYMNRAMPDKCKIGCDFETGADLPAQMQHNASFATAGICLIAESGTGAGGQLACQERVSWARRACTCVANMGDLPAGAGKDQPIAEEHNEI